MWSTPEAVGVSSRGLERLDARLATYVDGGRLPGALVLVARGGRIVHRAAFGLADRQRGVPVQNDTIFRIYSMTKPLTSVALLQLYERGLVALDDPVDAYLPALADRQVCVSGAYPDLVTRPADRAMTVADLLSHQSGLGYGLSADESPVDHAYTVVDPLDRDGTLATMVDKLAPLPLVFSPGERWKYSIATDVCARLVEVVSGRPFDAYLQESLLDPLGMADTAFWVPPAKLDRFAAGYEADASGAPRLVDDPLTSPYRRPPAFLSGGGGLVSTAGDYWRFAQALCDDGTHAGERILGRKTVDLLAANRLTGGTDLASVAYGRWSETPFRGVGFGLGMAVVLDPAAGGASGSAGELSWGGKAGTAFFVDRREQLVVVFLTQLQPSSATSIRREMRAIIYGALH